MAPNPQCSALAAAKERKGFSYADIATKIGKSEQHVIDGTSLIFSQVEIINDLLYRLLPAHTVCTGKVKPTDAEFNALAQALDISNVCS